MQSINNSFSGAVTGGGEWAAALGVNIGKDIKIGHRLKVSFWSILEGSKKIFDFN